MKHGQSDVERQISIQGIHLSPFGNSFWKREAFRLGTKWLCFRSHISIPIIDIV